MGARRRRPSVATIGVTRSGGEPRHLAILLTIRNLCLSETCYSIQFGTAKINLSDDRAGEVSTSQISCTQICAVQMGTSKGDSAKIGRVETGERKIGTIPSGPTKHAPATNDPYRFAPSKRAF